jgi:hypothetical protein
MGEWLAARGECVLMMGVISWLALRCWPENGNVLKLKAMIGIETM